MNWSKLFGGKGLDPTSLLLSGLSMFGGDQQPQRRESFNEPNSISDPRNSLYSSLSALFRLGQGMTERKPFTARSSYIPRGPEPVSIPGLGFQIGGGMGHDPALDDASLLTSPDRGTFKYDPFQSIAQGQFGQAGASAGQPQPSTTKRRTP